MLFRSPSSPSRPATPATPARPVGDIPIGGGKYLRKGKVVSSLYTPESPLQQSYASASRYDYAPATEPDTYGYQQLEREPESLARINAMATDTGLPPQWIADVAALHGTSGIDGPEELDILASKLKGRVIKTPTDLVAAILGDGSKVTELGVHAGRRYDSQFSRFDRVTARVHTALIADCRMCANLQAQAVFIPHKGELA